MSTIVRFIGWLLGIENAQSIDQIEPTFAANWAHNGPAWVFFGCVALAALSIVYYYRYQSFKHPRMRIVLTVFRAAVLSVLLIILADPVLTVKTVSSPRPLLWVLFDGTESMAIEDELPDAERARLAKAVDLKSDAGDKNAAAHKASRAEFVRAWMQKKDGNVLAKLQEKFRLQAFVLDRPDGVRAMDWSAPGGEQIDPTRAAAAMTTTGQVTALGKAFENLASRKSSGNLAGVVVVSDFDQNSGPPPLAKAKSLGVPVYAIGVGPTAAADLGVDLQAPPVMKKSERSTVLVALRQTGLENQSVVVTVTARRIAASGDVGAGTVIRVGERTVQLVESTQTLDFPFTPAEAGRFEFTAEVPPLPAETVAQNNKVTREVNVRDDFLRLMFVEYEPTWEWRFIKEVFHRDPLVGMRGFRTFLRSADPRVRTSNELFLPTLAPQRSEFFANDVIFLGDMPAETLSSQFCDMVKEYVGKFGGGLVIIAGPRFGPGQLASTPLAELLPIVAETNSAPQTDHPFRLRLTPAAAQTDFMRLGSDAGESAKAWQNLGALPWYQPVSRVHPLATVLAEHPTDLCTDGKTPQPLIAIRRYGRGEVVYLGFDETWRLRRQYGELYYRQFWGQMIHRLGLSHALGSQKRFVVRTDRPQYQADETATITVEAYDANFEPLSDKKLVDKKITGELILPDRPGETSTPQKIALAEVREGVFELRVPVYYGGEHRVMIKDPITSEISQVNFQVAALSAERRSAVRDVGLQEEIARGTGGKAYDLETASRLPDEISVAPNPERSVRVITLWDTWLSFLLVIGLMVSEWSIRKMSNLP